MGRSGIFTGGNKMADEEKPRTGIISWIISVFVGIIVFLVLLIFIPPFAKFWINMAEAWKKLYHLKVRPKYARYAKFRWVIPRESE
jgi:hypothetical protein